MTIRREPPGPPGAVRVLRERIDWYEQVSADLASGKHARGCECDTGEFWDDTYRGWKPLNSCTTIAKCLAEFREYSIEEEE